MWLQAACFAAKQVRSESRRWESESPQAVSLFAARALPSNLLPAEALQRARFVRAQLRKPTPTQRSKRPGKPISMNEILKAD